MSTDVSLHEKQERAHAYSSPDGSSPESNESDEISLLDILVLLAERKHIILWVTAVSMILATVLALVLPQRYTANVSLLTPQQNTSMGSALASQLNGMGGMAALAGGTLGLKSPNEIFVAMLKSRTIEDAMVQRFDLMREYHERYLSGARKAFEQHASVDANGKDGLIHISVYDHDPNRAAELANGYVDQFRKLSENLAITEASQRRLFFQEQLEEAKSNLANAEEALKKTEQTTGVVQLDSQARALVESATMLRAQITAKEVQIQSLRTFATSENAQLIQAEQELESLHSQLAKLGGDVAETDDGLIVPKGRVPEVGLEYVRKLRDVKYHETIFDILARQFELAKLDEAKEGALIQMVDAAVPPDRRSFPKRSLFALGGLGGGFILGIIVTILLAGFERMNKDSETTAKLRSLARALSFKRARNL